MQHTCYPCTIINWCGTAKRSNINREITAAEGGGRTRGTAGEGGEGSGNVGLMSGRGLSGHGEMHDGNTSLICL